ncbi:MAG: hypothetical protein IBX64_07210 [Actinobacteria bacterium]|nr:hypothetical protein [Actinomycetota bacterium]
MRQERLNVFSPEIFLPLFVSIFYLAGLVLVDFSLRALAAVLAGIITYLAVTHLTGVYIRGRDNGEGSYQADYFERLLLSLLIIFIVDLALKGFVPIQVRVPFYLATILTIFYFLGREKVKLSGPHYLTLGLLMILIYIMPSFVLYGLYGTYLNRTGGLMPAFLVGMGTIVTVYGLMKIASGLTASRLFMMIGLISAIIGPLMAATIGYRAYAIIYIMPLIFQYYLERRPPIDFRAGLKAAGVIILISLYTYLATSVARGVIYTAAPLESPRAPAYVVESMEKGGYTHSDMMQGTKVITRPFFTYKVFLEVVDKSFPWGTSHGRLTLSLMPGVNLGRATTIDILGKPFSTSFFGLSFLEFGFLGIVFFASILGLCLATASRLKDVKVYSIILTTVILWLDTGPSVWWHWLPFVSATITFTAILFDNLVKPKITGSKYWF